MERTGFRALAWPDLALLQMSWVCLARVLTTLGLHFLTVIQAQDLNYYLMLFWGSIQLGWKRPAGTRGDRENSPTCQAERQGGRRGAQPTPPACEPLSSPAKEGLLLLSGATQTAEAAAFLRPRAPAISESPLMAPAAQLQPLDHWEAKLGPL